MADYTRQTAKKCRINHLTNGNYVEQEGWNPNYIETELGKISRVNLMGVVVSKNNATLTVDDGTARIDVRNFQDLNLDMFDIGERVLIIGRPRVYNEQIFLAAEIVKRINNDKWLEHRKLEISLIPKTNVVEKVEVKEDVQTKEKVLEVKKVVKSTDDIISEIKNLDDGKGTDVDLILEKYENGEKIIKNLLEEGEIFEVKPGRVKVLE